MLDQQEISDRFELQDLIYRYSELIDARDVEPLRSEIFTEDAHIDYSAFGGSVGNVDETLEFLRQALVPEVFPNTQHLNANIQLKINGDTATGRVMCYNPMEMVMDGGKVDVFMLGLWYLDEYRRTPQGWRMSRREEVKSWKFNTPDSMDF